MSSAATAAGLAATLVYTNPHRRQLPPPRTRSRSVGSQKKKKGKVRKGTNDVSSTSIATLNQGQVSNSTLSTQPTTNYFDSTEAVDSIHPENLQFIAPSTDTKFRRDVPTRSGDTIPSSHHLLVAKTLSATNEAMPGTLNTRRRSPSLPSLYTYGTQALNFNAPFATSGPSPTFTSSDRTNMGFLVGDEGTRTTESRLRRPQKERSSSNVHDHRLQRSASFYFPEPLPMPKRRIVRPSTSPGITAPSPKPKTPFITIKWLTKRRDRKDSLNQGQEKANSLHHHHSESHGTYKFPPPPVTPPSSDFEDFQSHLRSSRRASIIQDTSEMNTHTRVSLIIDHVDVSDSDLEEEDPLSPTTPPPLRIARKDKLQNLLSEPSPHPHLQRKFPSKLDNSPTAITRPRLNLNLNFARPRPNPYHHSGSHSPVTPTYDEQDGWCIDDRYLSTQVADGEDDDDDDDDGGGITPVSDIVFGDRPPSPKPPMKQQDDKPREHEEWKSPMSPSDTTSSPPPPTSPTPSSSTVTKQVVQGPRRSPSPTGCHSAPFSDLPQLPNTKRSEETIREVERDDPETTPRGRGRRLSTGSSYGVIFSRATSPTPGLWSVVNSREVASEQELGPWVGYWNRGSLKEVLAELRDLRLNL